MPPRRLNRLPPYRTVCSDRMSYCGGRPLIMKKHADKRRRAAKHVLRLPDLDFAKRAVLNTLGSPESKRAYEFAIDDFIAWYCSEPRLAFSKPVVLRYRLGLASGALCPAQLH